MNTLAAIMNFYNCGDNDVFHHVLGRIMENPQLFFNGSIYAAADWCACSPATLSRLSQRLGFRNYSEFKHSFFDALYSYSYRNRVIDGELATSDDELTERYFDEICFGVERLRELLRQPETSARLASATAAIYRANSVHFYSQGICFSELSLQINLMCSGKRTALLQRFPEQLRDAENLRAKDLVVLVTPDREDCADVLSLLPLVRGRKASSILITDNPVSSRARGADFFFAVNGTGGGADKSLTYMYLDLLTLQFRRKYLDSRLQTSQIPFNQKEAER